MQSTDRNKGQFQGQPSAPVGGATQIIYAKKSGNTLYSNYSEFQSKVSGAAQITFGFLLALTNTVLLVTGFFGINVLGHGIWGGVMLIASGSVGVASSKRKTKCLAITYMIMCIVSSLLSIPVLIFAGFGVERGFECRYYDYSYRTACITFGPEFVETLSILMVVFTVLGGISAIWGSTLCCKAAACCSDDNEELVPMQIVTADSNQKTLPGNSDKDYLKSSALEGYEKLHQDDEVYDTIEDDDVKVDLDLDVSGYERGLKPAANNDENIGLQQNNYEKITHVIENNAESQGVADYDELIGSFNKKDDHVSCEKPANVYLDLESEMDSNVSQEKNVNDYLDLEEEKDHQNQI